MEVSWTAFRDGLAGSIATLPDGGALLVGDQERTECFVQFMFSRSLAEVASGWDPLDRPNLTEEQTAALERIGWPAPSFDPSRNHGLNLSWPAPSAEYRRVADMSVVALREVFEIPSPASLAYKAFVSPSGSNLPMPHLGIPSCSDLWD
ncbi:hypothetical protein ACWT_3424 [Actinoplanes sp. SE50]|uniref:TY-Chap domain-containing protein n=1 Tax=unclassified Actinoplanes TaxID=2626549 RepID=UPI00023ED43C|nr:MULTISPECIES: hypothetical protein [unclassified Actinoplanes]AEV84447.1 hypothetical protein ACPL_3552 [Actinoplanes sp. SE50/110]ATO82839.1 hypothetical protein ACWT_3424 [Actinoplanes sp. SE50]SLM00247.1 hypothetical protein ACSP50_3479 [Actinoplanes sp. SE50/110]